MKFEQSLARLREIVEQMESGEIFLDESIRLYDKGIALCAECARQLEEAKGKITKIGLNAEGAVEETPLELSEDRI